MVFGLGGITSTTLGKFSTTASTHGFRLITPPNPYPELEQAPVHIRSLVYLLTRPVSDTNPHLSGDGLLRVSDEVQGLILLPPYLGSRVNETTSLDETSECISSI